MKNIFKRLAVMIIALVLAAGMLPPGVKSVKAADQTLTITGRNDASGATGFYFNTNTNANPNAVFSPWADIRSSCNEEEYILINGVTVDWSSMTLQNVEWANCFYMSGFQATAGSTITVKKGFSMTLGTDAYVTDKDYTFFFDGSKWYWKDTLTINGINPASARTTLYFETGTTHAFNWNSIKTLCNEEDYIFLNGSKVDWSVVDIFGTGSGWQNAFYLNGLAAEAGTTVTVKQGFAMIINNIAYVTDKDYIAKYNGSAWCWTETLKINHIHSASGAKTLYMEINANPYGTVGGSGNLLSLCNEETHILVNDVPCEWGFGDNTKRELASAGWANDFYINFVNATEGTTVTMKKGFAMTLGTIEYVTDKEYRFIYTGSDWNLYTEPVVAPGDANGDGTLDIRDAVRLKRYTSGENIWIYQKSADTDGSNGIGVEDLELLREYLVNPYCLSAFRTAAAVSKSDGGWIGSASTNTVLATDTDATGNMRKGVLKLTYSNNGEASVGIHLARPVKAAEVAALHITIRQEGDVKLIDNNYNIIFYKRGTTGPWGLANELLHVVGTAYQTVSITDTGLLESLADKDGYIRVLDIETFGTGSGERNVYISDISYTPKRTEEVENAEIPLGVFSSPAPTAAAYKECAAAGFNFVLIDQNYASITSEAYKNIMGYCNAAGMKAVPMTLNKNDTTDFTGVAGYAGKFFRDEPTYSEFDTIADWAENFESQNGTSKIFFCNLFPNAAGTSGYGCDSYEEYLNGYIEKVLAKLNGEKWLSVDIYPLLAKADGTTTIHATYLQNLEATAQAVLNHPDMDITLHYYIQTHGHGTGTWNPRDISSAADIRYQYNCAMAYGVNAFSVFTYPTQNGEEFKNGMGLVENIQSGGTWSTEKTPVYDCVKQANQELKAWDDVYLSFNYQGTKAIGNGADVLKHNLDNLTGITAVSATKDTLIGLFDRNGTKAYMVTNYTEPSQGQSDTVVLTMESGSKAQVYKNGVKQEMTLSGQQLTLNLAAGEAAFVIVE